MDMVRFIKKGGKIIPVKSSYGAAKKAVLLTEMNDLASTYKKINSPFIKQNICNKLKELSDKFKMVSSI
jgi:hypothetical protein